MGQKLLGWVLFVIIVILGFLLVLPVLLLSALSMILVSIPQFLGGAVSVEDSVTKGLDRVIGVDLMREVRDDLMRVYYPYFDFSEDARDRHYLSRVIELSHESTVSRLQEGETVFAFLAGVSSILIISSPVHNILLTIVAFVLTFIVTVRVAATNILAFPSPVPENLSITELRLMARWNAGPIRNRGVIGMVVMTLTISLFTGRNSHWYNLAMEVLSKSVALRSGSEYRKWTNTTQHNENILDVINYVFYR